MQFLGNGFDVVTNPADVHASEPKRLQRNDRILGRKRCVDGAEQQAFQVGQSLQLYPMLVCNARDPGQIGKPDQEQWRLMDVRLKFQRLPDS